MAQDFNCYAWALNSRNIRKGQKLTDPLFHLLASSPPPHALFARVAVEPNPARAPVPISSSMDPSWIVPRLHCVSMQWKRNQLSKSRQCSLVNLNNEKSKSSEHSAQCWPFESRTKQKLFCKRIHRLDEWACKKQWSRTATRVNKNSFWRHSSMYELW